MIDAIDLSKRCGRTVAVRRAAFGAPDGAITTLLGGNGSGKTTFLHALLGIVPPRGGRLWLNPELHGRQGIGFVPQHCAINPSLPTTVREFVSLGLVGLPVERSERPARLMRALQRVGLDSLVERDYWALSGGQRQRALVARGLIREPALLILHHDVAAVQVEADRRAHRDLESSADVDAEVLPRLVLETELVVARHAQGWIVLVRVTPLRQANAHAWLANRRAFAIVRERFATAPRPEVVS